MRATVLHNPTAGGGRPSVPELIEALRPFAAEVDYRSTRDDLWRELQEPGDVMVVVGGDGTFAKAARLMLRSGVPLALVPTGTANNVAESLGIRGDWRELVAALPGWRPRALDMGLLIRRGRRERSFVEGVGFGAFAELLRDLRDPEEEAYIRPLLGQPGFTGALGLLARMLDERPPLECRIRADGEERRGSYHLLEVLNLARIGPALELAPGARPDDGLLHAVLVDSESREALLDYMHARMAGEKASVELPRLSAAELRIKVEPGGARYHRDDKLRRIRPGKRKLKLRCEPGAVTVLAPARG